MKNLMILLFIALPAVMLTITNGPGPLVFAQEDDTDDVDVEAEDTGIIEDDVEKVSTASKDIDTVILFTTPAYNPLSNLELPAGGLVEFLVGFLNKGDVDYVIETLNTSFRYPMDFSFYIQNFSTIAYNKIVKPNEEATLSYSFMPSETFAGRPFGLNINLAYRDANGVSYHQAVFNETVQIIELDEGLDGETVFLYIFLAACVILALVGGQQLLSSFGRKSRSTVRKPPVEVGTSNPNNVDYEWIPRQTLNMINKSPKSPKQSARQRKAEKSGGSSEE